MGSSQQFSLRWNNYLRHITGAFDSLRTDEDLVDVTLSCEGKKIRAHKMLLSACSSYFRELFKENPCQHPVIIFKDVKYQDLEALVDFMYQGEVNVVQEQLSSFLNTAELLAVQGLTDGSGRDGAEMDASDIKAKEDSQPATQSEIKGLPSNVAATAVAASASVSPVINNRIGPDSPVAKKRKCSSVIGASVNNANKDDNSRLSDLDSMEVIPVMSNVKVEQPDYYEQERVGQYSELTREQSIISGNLDSVTKEEKKDSVDIFSSNSSDKNQHSSPLLDINQVMGVSGPSLDALPQEPLQEKNLEENSEESMQSDLNLTIPSLNEEPDICNIEILFDDESETNRSVIGENECEETFGTDPYFGCNVCREAKAAKKDSGCPRCPICPNFSAPCSHLLKVHMKDFHGWFTVQRRFNTY